MLGHGGISQEPISSIPAVAAGGAPALDPNSLRGTRTSAPQQSSAREFAGYALVFAAAAALFTPAQSNAKTLIAAPQQTANSDGYAFTTGPQPTDADTIGAAEYTVGTHAETVASSQSPGFVKGTNPTLFPATSSVVVVVQKIAAPQQAESGYTLVWGQQPESVDPIVARTQIKAPEQVESGAASVFGPTPASVDRPQPKTIAAAPEQVASGSADLWGPTPQGIDKPPAKTLQAAPQQVDSGSANLSRYVFPFAASADPKIAATFFAAPEQIDSGSAWLTGQQPVSVEAQSFVGRPWIANQEFADSGFVLLSGIGLSVDAPANRTIVAAPEQIDSGSVTLFRYPTVEVSGTDVRPPATIFAAPQQIDDAYAKVWGTPVEAVYGTDTIGSANYTVGTHRYDDLAFVRTGHFFPPPVATADASSRTIVAAPQQVDEASARVTGKPQFLDVPVGRTQIEAPEQVDSGSAFLTGPQPEGIDRPQPHTIFAAPEQVPSGYAQVYGTDVAAPLGTDKPVGHFAAYFEPFYEPVQYGLPFHPNADLIPPPVVVPGSTGFGIGDPWKKRRKHKAVKDPQEEVRERVRERRRVLEAIRETLNPTPIDPKPAEQVEDIAKQALEAVPEQKAVTVEELLDALKQASAVIEVARPLGIEAAEFEAVEVQMRAVVAAFEQRAIAQAIALVVGLIREIIAEMAMELIQNIIEELRE